MLILSLLLAGILGLSACATPAAAPTPEPSATLEPTITENPVSPLMQTAMAKSTALAQVTLDPAMFPTVTPLVSVTPDADWKLAWAEEFDGPDGSAPDPQTWGYDVGGHGWGNNELEYYTDRIENAYLEGGNLVIEARKEEYQGSHYTSARLVTRGKVHWLYGRYEIRAKLPKGQGIWPAIWLLPDTDTYGGWPTGGEVDIMEFLGHDRQTVYGTLHWGNPHDSDGGQIALPRTTGFDEDYHVFALEWEPGAFRWYMDGVLYHTVTQWTTSAENAKFPAPFDQPFHMLINVAVGGNWPGVPNDTTVFPAKMYVDYVRVYQK